MTNRERIMADTALAAQIAAGLLASGHYTGQDNDGPYFLVEPKKTAIKWRKSAAASDAFEIVEALRYYEKQSLEDEDDPDSVWVPVNKTPSDSTLPKTPPTSPVAL